MDEMVGRNALSTVPNRYRKLFYKQKPLPAKVNPLFWKVSMVLWTLILCSVRDIGAQELSEIGKRKPFTLNGSVGAQMASRFSQGTGSDPFSYLVTAQLTPVFYGIDLPLSFTFADSRFSYAQPFSRLSFQPSYKWVKAYLGRTSMEMHPYGLSGHQFDGAGISLEPASFPLYFSAMYGRLCKAQSGDTSLAGIPEPGLENYSEGGVLPAVYKRTGYAFKAGFRKSGQQFDLHFFRASDRQNSLSPAWRTKVAPRENVVLALSFSFDLYEGLLLKGQAGVSALTDDSRCELEKHKGVLAGMTRIFMPQRTSTSLNTAYKIQLAYKGVSVGYERVGPDYETLGAPYFNRDFENVVVSFSHAFKKIDISADAGWQRDDIGGGKASRMNRIVGSLYINYHIEERFSLMASYSNFTVHTQMKPIDLGRPDEPLVQDPDTVAFRQIAQQAGFAFNFSTRPDAPCLQQQAGIDISYQSSREKMQEVFSDYVYAALRHNIVLAGDYRLQTAVNFSTRIDRAGQRPVSFNYHAGPSVTCSKLFLEKTLSVSAGLNYYIDMQGKQACGGIADLRLRGGYTLKKAHEFEMQVSGRLRSSFSKGRGNTGKEVFLQLAYRYRFSLDPFRKKAETSFPGRKSAYKEQSDPLREKEEKS